MTDPNVSDTDFVFEFLAVCGGSGGQTLGMQSEEVRLFGHVGRFKCRGSIDNDLIACADYERFTKSKTFPVDIMAIDAFWPKWMFKAAFGETAPHMVAISAPCKGASRLLSSAKARTKKYRQLNRLAIVWCTAMLEAWGDDPPALIVLENVPGMPTRARAALRSLRSLLRTAGYVFHASTHDCGEIGGLAQHRDRYLLVARHPKKCPPLLYQPPKKRVRGIGEVLSEIPMPATLEAVKWGDLHTMPRITWRNWLRLACIPAGGDWRDLKGVLAGRARRAVFRRHAVADWTKPIDAVTGPGGHSVEALSDPRLEMRARGGNWSGLGVVKFEDPSPTVSGQALPTTGAYSVSDPRPFGNVDRVTPWADPVGTVTSAPAPSSGLPAVADPRPDPLGLIPDAPPYDAAYGVVAWQDPARTIAGTQAAGTGAYAVADPRDRGFLQNVRFMTLDEAMELDLDPSKPPPFIPVITAEDGTWHRPVTHLELAMLQSYPKEVDGVPITFGGTRTQIGEHIGNSIPPDAARAIARTMLITLMQAKLETWAMSSGAVWVDRALSFQQNEVT